MRSNVTATLLSLSLIVAGCSSSADDPLPTPGEDATGDASTDTSETSSDAGEETLDAGDATDARADGDGGPRCGNGILEGTEACDDGNNISGDGCSATCENESVVPEDVCPGVDIPLTGTGAAPRKGSLSGDTSGAKATYDHSCGGGSGPDVVYSFTPDVTGRATVTIDATFAALLATRTACGDKATEVACDSLTSASGKLTRSFPVTAGAPVYLHVDGAGGTSGTFTLSVEVATAFCGNGFAELPEQCDDGNTVSGDGCSSDCKLEALGDISTCPGLAYSFKGNDKVSFSGDTGLLSGTSTSSFQCSTASAKNGVYAITPDKNGSLELEMRASFQNAMLHVRRECFTATNFEVDCTTAPTSSSTPSIPPGTPIKLTIPVFAGQAVFVFADAKNAAEVGPYVLDATLRPAACGNGALDGGEECDDGNTAAGDGCSTECKIEPGTGDKCADAKALAFVPTEEGKYAVRYTGSNAGLSDDFQICPSNTGTPDAVYSVVSPVDGWMSAKLLRNAFVTLDIRRACIEGTTSAVGATTVACANPSGGLNPSPQHGFAVTAGTPYWFVVDAKNNGLHSVGSYTLELEARPQVCGNDVIEGTEQCDDGNTLVGDGCSATCTLEPIAGGNTCADALAFPLTETSEGSGEYAGSVTAGTTNLTSNHSAAAPCGNTAGKDIWYRVTAPRDGVLVAKVGDTSWDVSLNARPSSCATTTGTASNFITCSNVTSRGNEEIAFPVVAGTSYHIIVDGSSAAPSTKGGAFTLDVAVKPSTCGDGVKTTGEECDDGNTANGDGCSSTCAVETLTAANTCPGFAVALTGAGTAVRTKTLTVGTTALTANYSGSCGGSARDGVVAVTPDVSGELRVQMTSDYANVLYARAVCADASTQIDCKAPAPATPVAGVRELVIEASAGVPVYLFVDGLAGESGTSQLKLTLAP